MKKRDVEALLSFSVFFLYLYPRYIRSKQFPFARRTKILITSCSGAVRSKRLISPARMKVDSNPVSERTPFSRSRPGSGVDPRTGVCRESVPRNKSPLEIPAFHRAR